MAESEPFILFIAGPAGAGKSAAADVWARSRPGYTAHIELDNVREYIKGGYADPRDGWSPDVDWQYRITRANCADMACRYVAEGITCVVDDTIFPLWEEVDYAGWSHLLGATPHHLVILLPDFATILARNARRGGPRLLSPEMLRVIYDMMLPWRDQHSYPVIDTSTLSVAQTAQRIQRTLGGESAL
ncbi:MAG TPA: AAA family ATPase [Ktedonobacterales bacterium]|nr:AAA family ATPase [Ktedonobacterales bacterium]